MLNGEVVTGQAHGPPGKLRVLRFSLIEMDQVTVVSDDGEGCACQVMVELINRVNDFKQLPFSGA